MCCLIDSENIVLEEVVKQDESDDIGEIMSNGVRVAEAIGSIFGANGEGKPEDTPNENPYEVTLVIEPEDNDKNKGDDNNDDSDNKEKT